MTSPQEKAIELILQERTAQDTKWGEQNHSPADWMMILQEEIGEYAQAEMEHRYRGAPEGPIKNELVQVCAVTVAMLENLLRNKAKP